ncbi:acyltransferase family protein [Acinetobacter silvestris]|uniref:Acyltransferase n=1 Tax=Acinetobacter silvestris TaxID=1977882 RepID=A0A1Y3CDC8_9GAMM|nr:acyltransferase family protein [Acinetobacter silvestris]OTG65057.1 acyltransferase [Acinetobacter silvestris]
MKDKVFRSDVNGLRAYAIIFVVLYHFKILGFSAGFMGVDIFFVISGYLMSKILIEKLLNNQFSFANFYLSRAIRIFPALLFLVLIITLLGWFILIPEEFKNYAKDAKYSITFLSNWLYSRQAGDYFAVSAGDKILLHTWSLAVEWQFYILFPIILSLFIKVRKNLHSIGLLLVFISILSLLLSVIITPKNSISSFFMLSTRAWEMLAGGIVYVYFNNRTLTPFIQRSSEIIGYACLFISLMVINKNTPWPGYAAILPIFGTVLILISNNQQSFFTRSKFIQMIGSSSYSIYLWHWPIVFFFAYFAFQRNIITLSLAITLSIILGWLSYKYIENTSRALLSKFNFKTAYLLLLSVVIVFYTLFELIQKDGIPSRASPAYLKSTSLIKMPSPSNGWCFYNIKDNQSLTVGEDGLKCHVASQQPNAKKALLFGDSFAGHNIPFWDVLGRKLNLDINVVATNWCYPSLNKNFTGSKDTSAYAQCLVNRNYLKKNIDQYEVLIFAGRWSDIVGQNQQNGFKDLLDVATQHHKKVIVMSEPYAFDKNISLLYKRSMWLNQDFNLNNYLSNSKATEQKLALNTISAIVSNYHNALLLTQADLFKPDQLALKNTPYSLDGRHMSIIGSFESEKYFETQPKYQTLKLFIADQNY